MGSMMTTGIMFYISPLGPINLTGALALLYFCYVILQEFSCIKKN